MSIRDKRAEILHLIDQVNRRGGLRFDDVPIPASVPPARASREERRRDGRAAERRAARREHLEERRQKLAELARRRARVEVERSEVRVLEAIRRLEQRVEQIEVALLGGGAGAAATPAATPASASGALPERVTSDVRYTLGGKLRDGLLCDLLQLVSASSLSGIFAVDDGSGEIRLFFDEGEICHAEGADVDGESAVFALMAREQGTYWFKETTALPERRTVQSKTQFLILEALRRIDEDRAGS